MTTHTDRFPLERGTTPEPLPDEQHSIETATLWAVHLRMSADFPTVRARNAMDTIASSGYEGLTGHMIGGDSFGAWAEVANEDEDVCLHVYFEAPDADTALARGRDIAGLVECQADTDHAVSTAADWAEQVWDRPVEEHPLAQHATTDVGDRPDLPMPEALLNDPVAYGYANFLNLASSRKEWQVTEQYDGTEDTTDDISPMVRAVITTPFLADIVVICPNINRDQALAASRVLGILQPDFITLMADAHVTQEPINPATGKPWAPGEMQNACDVDGACTVGLLDDCLSFTTSWRSGRHRMESLVYTVTKNPGKGNSTMVWTGSREAPLFDTEGDEEHREGVVKGLIAGTLDHAMAMPPLAGALGGELGLDDKQIARHTVLGALRALAEMGFAALVTTTDPVLNDALHETEQEEQ